MFLESGLLFELSALPGLRRVSGRALRDTGPERDEISSACSKRNPGKKNKRPKTALQAQFRQDGFRSGVRRARPGARQAEASLTVEAALVLPLFLFAMYLLILPLRMMDTSRIMQQACEEICQETVQLLYVQSLTDRKSAPAESGESAEAQEGALPPEAEKKRNAALTGNAAGMAAAALGKSRAGDRYVVRLVSLKSSVLGDGETVTLTLDYDYRLPFSVFGLGSIHQRVTASRRAWIGRTEGGLSSGASGSEEEDEIVYVGKTSTRYHSSASCHYLSNSLTPLPFAAVSGERNSGGKRYQPCARCAKGVTGGTVYIAPSGDVYHTSEGCSAIRAYARAVKKSEVSHLGPCSYCCH